MLSFKDTLRIYTMYHVRYSAAHTLISSRNEAMSDVPFDIYMSSGEGRAGGRGGYSCHAWLYEQWVVGR